MLLFTRICFFVVGLVFLMTVGIVCVSIERWSDLKLAGCIFLSMLVILSVVCLGVALL